MQEFINMAMQKFGTSEAETKSATGGLLNLIKDQVGGADTDELMSKIPGASAIADAAAGTSGGDGGGLGGMLGGAASALGGKLGAATGLMGILKGSGLGLDDAGGFVSMFTDYCRQQAGGDLVNRIVGQLPELKKFIG